VSKEEGRSGNQKEEKELIKGTNERQEDFDTTVLLY